MCGIAGFVSAHATEWGESALERMTNALAHRGPDASGYWVNEKDGVALGHRRLSIIELSPAGRQPMTSESGRFTIVYNGEIYNHLDLRRSLEKGAHSLRWRGMSDTETLLAGFDTWGVQGTVDRAVGMFAFAVWDADSRALILARDRMGEKPLYYGRQGGIFLFGSELKALKAHPCFKGDIDRRAIALMMRYSNIPAPFSIYKDIFKLPPGCLLKISSEKGELSVWPYWSGIRAARVGVSNPVVGSESEAIEELDRTLGQAVSDQMMSEVPLGAFLSGGIDSSTVVALMQKHSVVPVRSFSIGFLESAYDEAAYARRVAQHLGTEHTEFYVTPQDSLKVIPLLPTIYDEPFSDSSQIPTLLVAQLARQSVTVALSGDGGDELFCGYNRYHLTERLWGLLSRIPMPIRKGFSNVLSQVTPESWDQLDAALDGRLSKALGLANLGNQLQKGVNVLKSPSAELLYMALVSHWDDSTSLLIDADDVEPKYVGNSSTLYGLGTVQRMMALDTVTYLPDDILTKLDRAAMSVSLEARTPFLDHRVVEFAWRLPQGMKLRGGQTKWALRQVLYRYIPRSLVDRPKMGFSMPIDSWLRGPLREWAENLIDEARLRREGYFKPELVRRKWEEHLSGAKNWQDHLWDVLMFQAWLEAQSS